MSIKRDALEKFPFIKTSMYIYISIKNVIFPYDIFYIKSKRIPHINWFSNFPKKSWKKERKKDKRSILFKSRQLILLGGGQYPGSLLQSSLSTKKDKK